MHCSSHPLRTTVWVLAAVFVCGTVSTLAQTPEVAIIIGPVVTPDATPQLTGNLSRLKIDGPQEGEFVRFKTTLTLTNAGPTVARNVKVSLFVSSDGILGANASKVADIPVVVGKIGRGKSVDILVKHRVRATIAPFFDGKYLIVAFHADNVPFGVGHPAAAPLAAGPIKLP